MKRSTKTKAGLYTSLAPIFVMVVVLVIPGCASMSRSEFIASLQAWNGRPIEKVLSQWGQPTYKPSKPLLEEAVENGWDRYGDNLVLLYHYNSFTLQSGGGVSSTRGVIDSFGNLSMTTKTSKPYRYSSNCNVKFAVDKRGKGKVIAVIVPRGDCDNHLPEQFSKNATPAD